MTVENERRWLVKEMPDVSSLEPVEIEQHYLVEGSSIRIRVTNGNEFEWTKKVELDPDVPGLQDEFNVPLTAKEYHRLRKISDRSISKTRYKIRLKKKGQKIDLDVYRGALAGLVKAEVEFSSQKQREAFTAPPWFDRELTAEKWASNTRLAGKTYADIEPFILHGPSGKPASK